MKEYVIYGINNFNTITTLQADDFNFDYTKQMVGFVKDNCNVAIFNFNNIAGFKEYEQENE